MLSVWVQLEPKRARERGRKRRREVVMNTPTSLPNHILRRAKRLLSLAFPFLSWLEQTIGWTILVPLRNQKHLSSLTKPGQTELSRVDLNSNRFVDTKFVTLWLLPVLPRFNLSITCSSQLPFVVYLRREGEEGEGEEKAAQQASKSSAELSWAERENRTTRKSDCFLFTLSHKDEEKEKEEEEKSWKN